MEITKLVQQVLLGLAPSGAGGRTPEPRDRPQLPLEGLPEL